MPQPSLHEIYRHFCLHTIQVGLQWIVGKPTSSITDLAQFKSQLVDPTWNVLPVPIRLLGRPKVRWDEFFGHLRTEVFIGQEGKIALRPDAGKRMTSLVDRLFGAGVAAAAPAPPGAAAP